jgi:hypothetical protein
MKESLITSICFSIVALAVIAGVAIYNINDRKLMSANIDTAISKGIDPVSVRCTYVKSDDVICVAYAASSEKRNEVIVKSTK